MWPVLEKARPARKDEMTVRLPEDSLLRTRPFLVFFLAASLGLTIYLLGLYWPREYRFHLMCALVALSVSLGTANWLRERRK
jgi:hypothetical protein